MAPGATPPPLLLLGLGGCWAPSPRLANDRKTMRPRATLPPAARPSARKRRGQAPLWLSWRGSRAGARAMVRRPPRAWPRRPQPPSPRGHAIARTFRLKRFVTSASLNPSGRPEPRASLTPSLGPPCPWSSRRPRYGPACARRSHRGSIPHHGGAARAPPEPRRSAGTSSRCRVREPPRSGRAKSLAGSIPGASRQTRRRPSPPRRRAQTSCAVSGSCGPPTAV